MTKEEAIHVINQVRDVITKDPSWMEEATRVVNEAADMAIKALEAQEWIPCSERLPEKSGQYYVSGGNKVWICEFLVIPNFTGGWCNDVANPMVQAWMPCNIPEPYKEGGAV